MFSRAGIWIQGHPRTALTLFTLLALCPFITKPFNVDDPLFIWVAHQIQAHPADPYGFQVNWYGFAQPMWAVTQNPPAAGYFMALAAAALGWSEPALHGAFLLPAIAAILGTWRLARHFCRQPLLAAAVTLFTPVFLISANTLMCDVMMLACWVWSVVFWLEGLDAGSFKKLFGAGLLIALATMTKYYGICLVPLLAAYAVTKRKPLKIWLPALFLPLAVLMAYEHATTVFYGKGLLHGATNYVLGVDRQNGTVMLKGGIWGLAFTGGCVAPVFFFAPLLWNRRVPLLLLAFMVTVLFALCLYGAFWAKYDVVSSPSLMSVKLQMAFWMTVGLGVLMMAAADVWQHRDPNSIMLFLWVAGTFGFASFCNWTTNGRSILPMAPAVAILIIRRLERRSTGASKGVWLAAGLSLVFAVGLECADFSGAVIGRRTAQMALEKCAPLPGTTRFEGHWGFQLYMSQANAVALDFDHPEIIKGDKIVIPIFNTNLRQLNPQNTALTNAFKIQVPGVLGTWNSSSGAGFYDANVGPLPFVFSRMPDQIVLIYSYSGP